MYLPTVSFRVLPSYVLWAYFIKIKLICLSLHKYDINSNETVDRELLVEYISANIFHFEVSEFGTTEMFLPAMKVLLRPVLG